MLCEAACLCPLIPPAGLSSHAVWILETREAHKEAKNTRVAVFPRVRPPGAGRGGEGTRGPSVTAGLLCPCHPIFGPTEMALISGNTQEPIPPPLSLLSFPPFPSVCVLKVTEILFPVSFGRYSSG